MATVKRKAPPLYMPGSVCGVRTLVWRDGDLEVHQVRRIRELRLHRAGQLEFREVCVSGERRRTLLHTQLGG